MTPELSKLFIIFGGFINIMKFLDFLPGTKN